MGTLGTGARVGRIAPAILCFMCGVPSQEPGLSSTSLVSDLFGRGTACWAPDGREGVLSPVRRLEDEEGGASPRDHWKGRNGMWPAFERPPEDMATMDVDYFCGSSGSLLWKKSPFLLEEEKGRRFHRK